MPKQCQYDECARNVFGGGFCDWHQYMRTDGKGIYKIPKRKKRRIEQEKQYNEDRKQFLYDNPRCAVFPHLRSNQIHHTNGRREDRLCDQEYWLAVSDDGHKYIHKHVAEAEKKGWLIRGRNSK